MSKVTGKQRLVYLEPRNHKVKQLGLDKRIRGQITPVFTNPGEKYTYKKVL